MKAPILGLAVATLAFAGSTVYLWTQLQEERARTTEVTERTRLLNERLVEIERARADRDRRRVAAGSNLSAPSMPTSAANPESRVAVVEAAGILRGPDPGFGQSAAHQKMMRAQYRANNRRNYAGVGEELGLSKEKEKALIDLLSEQQLAGVPVMQEGLRNGIPDLQWQEKLRADQAQIIDLIGPEKAESLRKYQESLPARREVDMIARQLEGSDIPLSAEQRKRLTTAFAEERARVPMPESEEGHAQDDWRSDYEQRVNGSARSILNSDQYTAYAEFQQWQSEMREHFAISRVRGPGGDTVFVSGAAVMAAPAVAIRAPAPDSPKEK